MRQLAFKKAWHWGHIKYYRLFHRLHVVDNVAFLWNVILCNEHICADLGLLLYLLAILAILIAIY